MMLDLKQMNDEIHQNLVGVSNHRTLEFAQYLAKKNINVWIRYVVVPGWSDDDDSAHRLGELPAIWAMSKKSSCCPTMSWVKHKWGSDGRRVQAGRRPSAEERDHGAGKRHP